jgi:CHASE1-domain containing sensor protein
MERPKIITTRTTPILAVLTILAVGLVLASIASGESAHAQANMSSAAKNVTSATKSMTSGAGNKTMGAANKTSEAASSSMTNATQGGNKTAASNSTNPLAKVPIIGKLFGGK